MNSPVIDTHLHAWELSSGEYGWITSDLRPLDRNYGAGEIAGELSRHGVHAAVLVQAADTPGDTRRMLDICRELEKPTVKVVGWLPIERPDDLMGELERRDADRLVGVRHMIHGDPEGRWLERSSVREGLAVIASEGLTFDLVVAGPHQLMEMASALEETPRLAVVVNHLGNPGADVSPERARWARAIAILAEFPCVSVKVSGWGTQGGPETSHLSDWEPQIETLLEHFGPTRMMWGSDWPVSLLSASYGEHLAQLDRWLCRLNEVDSQAIRVGTASRVYGFEFEGERE